MKTRRIFIASGDVIEIDEDVLKHILLEEEAREKGDHPHYGQTRGQRTKPTQQEER